MRKNFKKLVSLMLIAGVILGMSSFATADYIMYANQDTSVRSSPQSNATQIVALKKGDGVIVESYACSYNGFIQVFVGTNQYGFVKANHLSRYKPGTGYCAPVYPSYSACPPVTYCPPATSVSRAQPGVCTACGDTYYATTSLNVRSGPGTNYSIVGSLSRNQQVTRIGKSGNWYKLYTTNGVEAYASASYLKKLGSSTPSYSSSSSGTPSGTYYANTGLNVRSGPGTGYSVVYSLNKGESVTYLGEKDGKWMRIRTSNGITGWSHGSYLSSARVSSSGYNSGYNCYTCNNVYYGSACNVCNYGYNWSSNNYCGTTSRYVVVGNIYRLNQDVKLQAGSSTPTIPYGSYVRVLGVSSGSSNVTVEVVSNPYYSYIGQVPVSALG